MCRGTGGSRGENAVAAEVDEGGVEEEVRKKPVEESDFSGTDAESEAEGEEVVWGRSGVNAERYKKKMAVWKNEIIGKGQKFQSADAFRYSIWKYAIAHKFDYKLARNCKQRIVVKCKARRCDFFICVRGNLKVEGMVVKEFRGVHKHSVGDECQMGKWGRRRLRARLLARLIEGKIRMSNDCLLYTSPSPRD